MGLIQDTRSGKNMFRILDPDPESTKNTGSRIRMDPNTVFFLLADKMSKLQSNLSKPLFDM